MSENKLRKIMKVQQLSLFKLTIVWMIAASSENKRTYYWNGKSFNLCQWQAKHYLSSKDAKIAIYKLRNNKNFKLYKSTALAQYLRPFQGSYRYWIEEN